MMAVLQPMDQMNWLKTEWLLVETIFKDWELTKGAVMSLEVITDEMMG